jgi:dihydrofolate reductase
MGTIVVTEFISLDGVIEAPGGGEEYKHAGWTFEFDRGEDGDAFKLDEVLEAEAQLLGRRTYEGFAAAWPSMEEETGEFGQRMNRMPKYVATSTLRDLDWTGSERIEGDVAEGVRALRDRPGRDLLLAGSAQLFNALSEADLIDLYRFMVHPVVLGSGARLFADGGADRPLRLAHTEQFGSGIVILEYEPVRAS